MDHKPGLGVSFLQHRVELAHERQSPSVFHDQCMHCVMKRTMDVAGATVFLCLTGPLLLVLMPLIRLTSPGPSIFRQEREGKDGLPFTVIKLRTMADAHGTSSRTTAKASVTKFGRWLRVLHIDELPQLVLVIRGSMSLVGPRPLPLALARELRTVEPAYKQRMAVRPGITGLAQIHFIHGDCSVEDTLQKLVFDLKYVNDQSFHLDMRILGKTLAHSWWGKS